MSDNSQLARTGLAGGGVVIGGAVFTGWELLLAAAVVLALAGVAIRVGFRRGRGAGER